MKKFEEEFKETIKKLNFLHYQFKENDLMHFFLENKGRVVHKWLHYFEIYDRYFNKFRNRKINILEIGVNRGGSLQMWRRYFGEKANIFGIDILEGSKILEKEGFTIFIGNQSDTIFLNKVANSIGKIDIVIDDGGHTMDQQIVTFEELFPFVSEDGIFLCEDTHTSYWSDYNGGYKKQNTFIEYAKNLVDDLHAYHSKSREELKPSYYTKNMEYIHFYDSIVVMKKRKRGVPFSRITGNIDWREKRQTQQSPAKK